MSDGKKGLSFGFKKSASTAPVQPKLKEFSALDGSDEQLQIAKPAVSARPPVKPESVLPSTVSNVETLDYMDSKFTPKEMLTAKVFIALKTLQS